MCARLALLALAALAACTTSSATTGPARREPARSPGATAPPAPEPMPAPPPSSRAPEPAPAPVQLPPEPAEPPVILPPAPEPLPAVEPPPAPPAETYASSWDFCRRRYDADQDGRVTRAEYTRSEAAYGRLDVDEDGVLTEADFHRRYDRVPRVPDKRTFSWGEGGPGFGDPAPDFRLTTTTGAEIDLARFRGHRPVVLVFGSFT